MEEIPMNNSTTSASQTFMAIFPFQENDGELIDQIAAAGYNLVVDMCYDFFTIEGKWESVCHALEVFKGGRLVLA